MQKFVQVALLWLVSEACIIFTNAQVVLNGSILPGQADSF